MSIKKFNYNGSIIPFATSKNDGIMVNATEMAKPFGKRVQHFLSTDSTSLFLEALSQSRNIGLDKLVITIKGGNNPGTWLHEDVAMEFARWLNPHFAIWCNDRIKELVKHGATALNPESLLDPDYVIKVMTALKEERHQKELAQKQLELASQTIIDQVPKVKYHDEVLQSVNTYTTTQIAKELGMSAKQLNRLLYQKSIQFKQSGQWLLYSKFQGLGLTKTRTWAFDHSDGTKGSNTETVWTEKGREFIHSKIQATIEA